MQIKHPNVFKCSWEQHPLLFIPVSSASPEAMRNATARCWVPSRPILCPRSVARDKRTTETRAEGSAALLPWVRTGRIMESFLCLGLPGCTVHLGEALSTGGGRCSSLIIDGHTHKPPLRDPLCLPEAERDGRGRILWWCESTRSLSISVVEATCEREKGTVLIPSDIGAQKTDCWSLIFVEFFCGSDIITAQRRPFCPLFSHRRTQWKRWDA